MPKSYFKLSQEEVDSLVEADIFGLPTSVGLGVYEIGCGGKSTVKFAQMLKIGVIDSYEGDNIEQGMVDEAKARGLKAKLVGRNYDHSGDFKALKERFG